MKHRRVSNKRIKQMLNEIGIGNEHDKDDDQQLLLEKRHQSVSPDKQVFDIDSENK